MAKKCKGIFLAAGISDSLIFTTPRDQTAFRDLLGSGEKWGISFENAAPPAAKRLAAKDLVGKSSGEIEKFP